MDISTKKDLTGILQALSRPLEVASRDDFSKINNLKGTEELASQLLTETDKLVLPVKAKKEVEELKYFYYCLK